MSRRKKINKREIELDPKYKDKIISKFVNVVMLDGKKTTAEKILYSILEKISKEKKTDAIKFFHDVLDNVKPRVEVRSRRVGGATYQVPHGGKNRQVTSFSNQMDYRCSAKKRRKKYENEIISRIFRCTSKQRRCCKKKGGYP